MYHEFHHPMMKALQKLGIIETYGRIGTDRNIGEPLWIL